MRLLLPPDWSDVHSAPLCADLKIIRAAFDATLNSLPPWVQGAMNLRSRIIDVFGLRVPAMDPTAGGGMLDRPLICDPSQAYGLDLMDRHFSFTLEPRHHGGAASLQTRIWSNHWTGRLSLAVVLIPQKIIVKRFLRTLP